MPELAEAGLLQLLELIWLESVTSACPSKPWRRGVVVTGAIVSAGVAGGVTGVSTISMISSGVVLSGVAIGVTGSAGCSSRSCGASISLCAGSISHSSPEVRRFSGVGRAPGVVSFFSGSIVYEKK